MLDRAANSLEEKRATKTRTRREETGKSRGDDREGPRVDFLDRGIGRIALADRDLRDYL